jgi:hypothetical protein
MAAESDAFGKGRLPERFTRADCRFEFIINTLLSAEAEA